MKVEGGREGGREEGRGREREGGRKRQREAVCVCVHERETYFFHHFEKLVGGCLIARANRSSCKDRERETEREEDTNTLM